MVRWGNGWFVGGPSESLKMPSGHKCRDMLYFFLFFTLFDTQQSHIICIGQATWIIKPPQPG